MLKALANESWQCNEKAKYAGVEDSQNSLLGRGEVKSEEAKFEGWSEGLGDTFQTDFLTSDLASRLRQPNPAEAAVFKMLRTLA